jgi:ubiquitin-like-conjugating enzyme ATG3
MFQNIKNKVVNIWNANTPSEIPKTSQFYQKGILTPYEFMDAGDRLILANPIWSWQKASKPNLEEKTLAPEKQFLSAQIVSKRRLKDNGADLVESQTGKDGWTNIDLMINEVKELRIDDEPVEKREAQENKVVDLEDVLDSDDEEESSKDQKPLSKEPTSAPKDENLRIYKVNITYDRHYLTPRFWLSGVDYLNRPLTKEQIFEEVMGEYKDKTVTFDKHPHLDVHMANIHPCRHADVIKTLVNQAMSNGKEIKPDQCLFIFLKFISSVMPALEIDFTTEIEI